MAKNKIVYQNGHKVEYIPIVTTCSYYFPDSKTGVCTNCNGTRKYIQGYHMIIDDKIGYTVDTINK